VLEGSGAVPLNLTFCDFVVLTTPESHHTTGLPLLLLLLIACVSVWCCVLDAVETTTRYDTCLCPRQSSTDAARAPAAVHGGTQEKRGAGTSMPQAVR
jgi:hypothetical protein